MAVSRTRERANALLARLTVDTWLENDESYFGALDLDGAKAQRTLELRDVAQAVLEAVLLNNPYETIEMAIIATVPDAVRRTAALAVVTKFRAKVAEVDACTTKMAVAQTGWDTADVKAR
jgi:hypothetical protein